MKQKTDVELLSEEQFKVSPLGSTQEVIKQSIESSINSIEDKGGYMVSVYVALSAMSNLRHQLQATVDELKQHCEELEKYAGHKDGCEERSYYQSSCKKCGYLLKDHDGKFCVVLNDGKISYHKAEQFDPNLGCTCGLNQLLTPNERK